MINGIGTIIIRSSNDGGSKVESTRERGARRDEDRLRRDAFRFRSRPFI
jgi:hypothetical protein